VVDARWTLALPNRTLPVSDGTGAKIAKVDMANGREVRQLNDEPLRVVVYRIAEKGFTRLPVNRTALARSADRYVHLCAKKRFTLIRSSTARIGF
jgi:hypothetical protein